MSKGFEVISLRSVLVTGGTGSLGKKLVETILRHFPTIERLVVFSRDELKQSEMAQQFSHSQYAGLRYFIGDVRDEGRLRRAFEGIDVVIHAAALKQVPAAEYNPMEYIKTNIIGAENVVSAALDSGVKTVVALSTDKAAAPINLYGATKLCSDKLFVAANNIRGKRDITFSVVRYGNVIGSRGSVVPFFLNQVQSGVLPITDPAMTRFNITLEEAVQLVLLAVEKSKGGEIYIPKIPSYRILDVAQAIGPHCQHRVVGIRPGEKLHEDLIMESDALTTIELPTHFVVAPFNPGRGRKVADICRDLGGTMVPPNFSYNSARNDRWLTVDQLREQIRLHVDPHFVVAE